jgi:Zn-dependent protease with chaperone function
MIRQPSDVVGLLFVAVFLGAMVLVGVRTWLGHYRAWYERPDPSSAMLIDVAGPSPLMMIFVALGIGLALLGMLLSRFLVLEVLGIGVGLPLAVLGLAIAVVRPKWALPKWMREVDEKRPMAARVRSAARQQRGYWALYIALLVFCVGVWLAVHAWR